MTWTTRPRSDFGQLSAIKEGSGPPLLLLHGVGLRAEAWGAQLKALSSDFTVIAPDMPGHGKSEPFGGVPKISNFTDRVADAIENSKLSQRCLTVGHSMGAMIALDLASRYPKLISGVAALNAVFRRSEEAKHAIAERVAKMDGVTTSNPDGPISRWFGLSATPESQACREWLLSANAAGYHAAYAAFAAEDGPPEETLRSLSQHALFMTGAQDPNSTPEMSDAMAALAPFGMSEHLADAAHMMPMTHATEVNAAILSLFARSQSEDH